MLFIFIYNECYLGLIIEWYRRDFQESAEEMNIKLVKIINLSHEKGAGKKQ